MFVLLASFAASSAFPGPVLPGSPAGDHRPTFIVTVEVGTDPAEVARSHGIPPTHVYDHALPGFAAPMSELARAGLLRDHRVVRVEQDTAVSAFATAPSWGLDRIDQRAGLDGTYTPTRTGTGVDVYIVDTGLRTTHTRFGGRARIGYDHFGEGGVDCNGHGTHVAGTVGAAAYGVAQGVDLVGVRVLDCYGSGSVSGVIAGLDWIVANARGPSVVNMSLGGGASTSMDDAVQRVNDAGITVVVAAGNSDRDACGYSPARSPAALTVGATDSTDTRAYYSNWGSCVDVFAPGTAINSTYNYSDTSIAQKSGTSMASPHAAGVAALVLEADPGAAPAVVRQRVQDLATPGVVADSTSPTSDLLYALVDDGGSGAPANAAPVADFDWLATDLDACFTDLSADVDGTVVSFAWSFGDGATSAAQDPCHTFPEAGTWDVTLRIADDDGATDAITQAVTVTAPVVAGIELAVETAKYKGTHTPRLYWSGATSSQVDVWRDGYHVARTPNDGSFQDDTGVKGRGSYTYQLCEAASSTCSDPVVAKYQ